MECYCCGEDRDPAAMAALACHADIEVCRVCIGWLRSRAGVPDSTPILPVRDIDEALAFYERAGFRRSHVRRRRVCVHGTERRERVRPRPRRPRRRSASFAGGYLIVPDVGDWYAQLQASGLPVTALEDQQWGIREFTLTDPSGNHIRIGKSTPDSD